MYCMYVSYTCVNEFKDVLIYAHIHIHMYYVFYVVHFYDFWFCNLFSMNFSSTNIWTQIRIWIICCHSTYVPSSCLLFWLLSVSLTQVTSRLKHPTPYHLEAKKKQLEHHGNLSGGSAGHSPHMGGSPLYSQQNRYSPNVSSNRHLHPANDTLLGGGGESTLLPSAGFTSGDFLTSPHNKETAIEESPNPMSTTHNDSEMFSDFFNFEPNSELAQWSNFPSTVS